MKKTLFVLFVTLLLFSCNRQKVEEFYYPDGTVQMKIEKKGDMMHGRFLSFYSNGKKELDCFYVNNIIEGVFTKYYYSGIICETGNYVKGKREGSYLFYDEFGRFIKEVHYVNDTLNGAVVEYYSSGNIKLIGNYTDGWYNGTWSYWDVNGEKLGVADFKKGSGTYFNYHSNGVLAVECPYEDNKRNGSEKFYTDKGVLFQENVYQNDILLQEIKYDVKR